MKHRKDTQTSPLAFSPSAWYLKHGFGAILTLTALHRGKPITGFVKPMLRNIHDTTPSNLPPT